jgi:hypothetical protein
MASTFAARNCWKIGATIASSVLSPLMPTDHSSVTRHAYARMPGSVFRAKTSGVNAVCSRRLMSTPATKRTSQNTATRKTIGLSERNVSYTTAGTWRGSAMTQFRSVKNFCTRTVTSATRMAVNSPLEPRPSIDRRWSAGRSWISRNTSAAMEALTTASCFSRVPRSYAIAKHTKTASSPNVAVTGSCSNGR